MLTLPPVSPGDGWVVGVNPVNEIAYSGVVDILPVGRAFQRRCVSHFGKI
eukprot:TRINITY_DN605_c1_g1_i1.p2 TRINITY_DN605_c1_g1~~TRINITY_DN605_c1_g1_i1.p2  ORF type:complete len:50 (-),score=7.67 TRINITY_DN605_c1_g1_i1:134-283(-)